MEAPASPNSHRLALALVLLALVPVVLWPADVSWLIDESRILAAAWHANHDHQLADGGLYGNFGIRYGPLPTQLYQVLLLLTHDPVTLVVLRGLLCAGVTAGALLWLARSLALPAWFAAGVLISPHVVAYQRVLWDASFCLPLGALALATFAYFLRTQRPWSLRLCVGASAVLPLIHPQALPCAVPILAWLGWQHRADLWRDRRALAILATVLLVLHAVYLVQATGQLATRFFGSVERGYPKGGSHLASARAPFLGGVLIGGALSNDPPAGTAGETGDYLASLARPAPLPALQAAARWSACLIYPLIWLGIVLSAWRGWRAFGPHRLGGKVADLSVRDRVTFVASAGLLCQMLLAGLMRIPSQPQYFFGTFILHAFMGWLAVDFLCRWRPGVIPGALYVAGSAVLTVSAALVIHAHGFERPRWPTLGNDVAIVRELNGFAEPSVLTDIPLYQKNPQILRALRLLLPPATREVPRPAAPVLLRYRTETPPTGQVVLTEIPPGTATPPAAQPLDVTPLPKNWVPDPATW